MKCPNCEAKIKSRHYDPEYEWYECPNCEGCFTPDEIIKADVQAVEKKVEAKGKKRLTQIQEDEEALAEFEKKEYEVIKTGSKKVTKHHNEVSTGQVVTTIAAELQTIYNEMGSRLDDDNARDKALILWRDLHHTNGVPAREQTLKIKLCEDHA